MPDAPSVPPPYRPAVLVLQDGPALFLHHGPSVHESRIAISARFEGNTVTITKDPDVRDWLAEAPDGPHESVRDAFLSFMGRWLDGKEMP